MTTFSWTPFLAQLAAVGGSVLSALCRTAGQQVVITCSLTCVILVVDATVCTPAMEGPCAPAK